jgi:hypothetical protein
MKDGVNGAWEGVLNQLVSGFSRKKPRVTFEKLDFTISDSSWFLHSISPQRQSLFVSTEFRHQASLSGFSFDLLGLKIRINNT